MTQVRETLAGRYELHDILGRGGMGVVYRATDGVLGRTVAVKVLPVDRADDPMFVARFEREALAAAALSHPNIVAIYDSGRDEDTRFIVMECVPGLSLAQLLAKRGHLESEQAVPIATQVADALVAAHRAGIVHRDIKPANVMVSDGGRVKVLDFGIARAAAYTALTQTDTILGSAPYLAPEIARGLPADARSDIYSLGCVLYATLTGEPPFTGLPAAVMHQHNSVPPRPPHELNPGIPPGLETLLLGMLAKLPEDRPQEASQVALALPAALASAPVDGALAPVDGTAATVPMVSGAVPETPTMATTPLARPTRLDHRHRRFLAGAVLLAVAALALALASSGSTSHKVAFLHPRSRTAHKVRARSGTTSTTTRATATSRPVTSRQAPAPLTVDAAARDLAALVVGDLRSGQIDQPAAQQILGPVQGALSAYASGHLHDALAPVGGLPAQIAQGVQGGDIQSSAVGGLDAAVTRLQSALERAAPAPGAVVQAPPPGQAKKDGGAGPPGGAPPGQAKKKDKGPKGGPAAGNGGD